MLSKKKLSKTFPTVGHLNNDLKGNILVDHYDRKYMEYVCKDARMADVSSRPVV